MDSINPKHYRSHPSGVECIEITRHMNFNLGNAIKYIWRAGEKGDAIEDLQKAEWYIRDEIERLRLDTSESELVTGTTGGGYNLMAKEYEPCVNRALDGRN